MKGVERLVQKQIKEKIKQLYELQNKYCRTDEDNRELEQLRDELEMLQDSLLEVE